jgi:hypothetical protein
VEGGGGRPFERFAHAADIQNFFHLPVGFGGIPGQGSLKPGDLMDGLGQFPDRGSDSRSDVQGGDVIIPLRRAKNGVGAILDIEKLADGFAGAPDFNGGGLCQGGFDEFPDQGGNDMGAVGVIGIARPIEIGQNQVNRIEIVLFFIGPALDGHHFFGQAIVDDGFMGWSIPELGFIQFALEITGIGAGGADADEFLDFGQPGGLHHVGAHDQVFVIDPAGIELIDPDSPVIGGAVDDDLGLGLIQALPAGFQDGQIEILLAWDEDRGAGLLEGFDDVTAEKSGSAGDDDSLMGPVCHVTPFCFNPSPFPLPCPFGVGVDRNWMIPPSPLSGRGGGEGLGVARGITRLSDGPAERTDLFSRPAKITGCPFFVGGPQKMGLNILNLF